jgi:3-dehydroquinate dehydratase/shikimate dehydrogenase
MIVFDTVYNPESTLLLKDAKSHGCKTVTGVEMFIKQAAIQFWLFTGQEASEARMRETLRRAIGPQKY